MGFCQKISRRLELSILKNTPHGRWGQGPGSVGPRFLAGWPFPVPQILEFIAFRDSGKFFQQFFPGLSRSFPGEPPNRPRKQPQPSRVFCFWASKQLNFHLQCYHLQCFSLAQGRRHPKRWPGGIENRVRGVAVRGEGVWGGAAGRQGDVCGEGGGVR